MERRIKGEGMIRYVKERDEYVGRIRYGMRADGKPNEVYFYSGKGGKRADVVQKMNRWRLEHQKDYAIENNVKLSDGLHVWLETCKKQELKPASYDRLESTIICQIEPRIGWRDISDLTDTIIQSELLDPILIDDGLSVSTAKKAYNALNAYLKYAVYKHMITYNPMGMIKAPKQNNSEDAYRDALEDTENEADQALSKEEMKKLQSVLYTCWKRPPQNRRYVNGGAIDLILHTGLRMGEALALKWSDINTNKNTLSVTKNLIRVKNRGKGDEKYKLILQDTPKTNKSRRVLPLNKAALAALEDLKKAPGYKPNGFIIHTSEGRPLLPRTIEEMLENMCKAAGIRKIGVHALRPTYATRLFEKNVDIKIISELLGHSSTEITYRIYIHVIDSLKESAVQALDLD